MNQQDKQDLTRVGPGTPMGQLLRRYWLPAGLSSDLPEPDCDPVRVTLVGQDFVAFRNSDGVVGLLDEYCAHRGASLVLGRVGGGGIECLYHGWRFSVEGGILEMPNCDDQSVRARYKANAYPVREAGGVIWVYLGPEETCPPLPQLPWMSSPDRNRYTRLNMTQSNFVVVMEGLVDSSHLGVLHQDALPKGKTPPRTGEHFGKSDSFRKMTTARAPSVDVEDTSFGLYSAAIRQTVEDGEPGNDIRITAFIAPFTVYVPFDRGRVALMVVPMDDERSYFYNIQWDPELPLNDKEHRDQIDLAAGTAQDVADRWGFSRRSFGRPGGACRENNWQQDREAMRRGDSYSGLPPFFAEDAAMTGSMAPISDRQESLVPADLAVVRMRRLLLNAARSVVAGGSPPSYEEGRSASDIAPIVARLDVDADWRDLIRFEPAKVP
ncbi:hypothetical protein AU184_08845 [Mycolicibacterium novocastrense]|uniref:Rieske 2Fe-2S domain-containing protein n=1 Tax=Mycolicibacterium novocastrense TaxID=59813 RepID=UPI00074A6AE1|nr:Rieske 2Fe-2S domain-containing protein [Mycolicibacterium novocastrense]KUH69823.1 hypothetical protein AU184_08845 [Mycolicibacterium novocastrense]KUH71372.1 hypothetical protein AU183_06215 [Mycolicibacterium novocastrense]KUH74436.1 hypothetical protein AU072_17630 [Mycolicibacterium novocastrense]